MVKKFDDLPEDARQRIRTRNAFSDELSPIEILVERVGVMAGTLYDDYSTLLPNERVMQRWVIDHDRVCTIIDIIHDYIYDINEKLQSLENKINEENAADGWGGIIKHG